MMRRPPIKARRDSNEADIVAAITAHGISVYPIDLPCDLLCGYGGVTYLVEIKSGKRGKQTPAQVKFQRDWGGHYQILRSVDEALQWAKNVRQCGGIQFDGIINNGELK